MVKFSELVSSLKVENANDNLGRKIKKEVDFANRPVKPSTLTKAEAKEIEKRFEENNRIARERELTFQRKRQNEVQERRKQREAERKAAIEKQKEQVS